MADKEILIINQGYIRGNLGDQAIRVSLNRFFREKEYLVDYAFLTDPNDNRPPLPEQGYINNLQKKKGESTKNASKFIIFLSIIKWILLNIVSIIKKVSKKKYDYVIIGGGQLINSSNSFYPHHFSYSMYLWGLVSKLLNRKVIFLGVGSNRKFNTIEKSLYKWALRKADIIFVRDTFSEQAILTNFDVKVTVMPDIAFYDYDKISDTKKRNILAVNIYSYKEYNQNYNQNKENISAYYHKWIRLIREHPTDGDIHLFSTTPTDFHENISFLNFVNENKLFLDKIFIMNDVSDLHGLYDLYENSSTVISARMHAILIGIKKGAKPVVFEISDKLSTFKNEYISSGIKPEVNKNNIKNILDKYF